MIKVRHIQACSFIPNKTLLSYLDKYSCPGRPGRRFFRFDFCDYQWNSTYCQVVKITVPNCSSWTVYVTVCGPYGVWRVYVSHFIADNLLVTFRYNQTVTSTISYSPLPFTTVAWFPPFRTAPYPPGGAALG